MQIGREEIKLSQLVNDMTFYVYNFKKSTKRKEFLRINEF